MSQLIMMCIPLVASTANYGASFSANPKRLFLALPDGDVAHELIDGKAVPKLAPK